MSTPTPATTTFSVDLSTAQLDQITAAFGASYGYQATLPDGTANPEDAAAFTRRMVLAYIVGVVSAYEAQQAAEAARAEALAAVNAGLVLS